MNSQTSDLDNPRKSKTKIQRNQNSLRVTMYIPSESSTLTPDDIQGLGDYQCPLPKTLMPV